MAKKLIRRPNGVPSANEKIVQVNANQGIKGLNKMQGTTRVIMDSVKLATAATSQTYNLFENCANRQFPLTNIPENKLQIGESIVVQRFSLYITQTTTNTTDALSVTPFDYFASLKRLYASQLTFFIAGDQVIKKLPLASMYAPFNPDAKFMGLYQFQPAAGDFQTFNIPHDIYHMRTNLVIPQLLEFVASVQVPALTLPAIGAYDYYLTMKIEGIGSLYAPKGTY